MRLPQADLHKLGYEQHPQLAGQVSARSGHVPLFPLQPAPKRRRKTARRRAALARISRSW